MIAGLPGFGLSSMFYALLLLGMGVKGLAEWLRRAGQRARGSHASGTRPQASRATGSHDIWLPDGVAELARRSRAG
jgi:hypothetical protein